MQVILEPKIDRNKAEVKALQKIIKQILRHDEMQAKRKRRNEIDVNQIRLF